MITQKDLLSESFWGKFKTVASGLGAATKQIASKVLPQTTQAISSIKQNVKDVTQAYKLNTNDKKFLYDYAIDSGYFPTSEIKGHKSKDGNRIYVFDASALDYNEKGEPQAGRPYAYPRLIIQRDANNQLKIIDRPRDRDYTHKVKKDNKSGSGSSTPPPTTPPSTPPPTTPPKKS